MLAVYKKNSPKEKYYSLAAVAPDMKTAKKYSKDIIDSYREIGYDDIETTIVVIKSVLNIPGSIDKPQPEKLLFN